MSDGQTIVIPGPYGPGHPWYEIGFAHGKRGRQAYDPRDETYMNGWSAGYAEFRQASTSAGAGHE